MAFLISICLSTLLGCAGSDVDPGNGSVCMQALYDPCNEEHDCDSNMCQLFNDANIQVCTQSCDADNPCPDDASGNPATCNNRGICKPAVANDCRVDL